MHLPSHLKSHPYMRKGEPEALARVLHHLPPNPTILEIGTFKGLSAIFMAKQRPDAKITTIDPHVGIPSEPTISSSCKEVLENCKYYNVKNIVHFPVASQIYKPKELFDLLFIDGDHTFSGVSFDYIKFSRYVKEDGWIIFHDFGTHHGVTKLCKTLHYKKQFQYFSLFVCQK